MKFNYNGHELTLYKSTYYHGGNVYLGLIDEKTGESYCDVTVNLPELELFDHAIAFDHNMSNDLKFMLIEAITTRLLWVIPSGYVNFSVYEYKAEILAELPTYEELFGEQYDSHQMD